VSNSDARKHTGRIDHQCVAGVNTDRVHGCLKWHPCSRLMSTECVPSLKELPWRWRYISVTRWSLTSPVTSLYRDYCRPCLLEAHYRLHSSVCLSARLALNSKAKWPRKLWIVFFRSKGERSWSHGQHLCPCVCVCVIGRINHKRLCH